MHKVFFIFLALITASPSIAQKEEVREVEKKSVLSQNIIKILENTDTVTWYLLDPMSNDTTAVHLGKNGEVLSKVICTDENEINALVSALTYYKSFEEDSIMKDCTFLPDVAFNIRRGGDTLEFAYSFYCDVCRFTYKKELYIYNGELVRDSILQIALEVFPKDRYLRRLAGLTR